MDKIYCLKCGKEKSDSIGISSGPGGCEHQYENRRDGNDRRDYPSQASDSFEMAEAFVKGSEPLKKAFADEALRRVNHHSVYFDKEGYLKRDKRMRTERRGQT